MKVIEHGTGLKLWSIICFCTGKGNTAANNNNCGCGAKLEIFKEDLFHTYSSCMGREEDWYYTFKCPECGCLTDIIEHVPFPARSLPTKRQWEEKQLMKFSKEQDAREETNRVRCEAGGITHDGYN